MLRQLLFSLLLVCLAHTSPLYAAEHSSQLAVGVAEWGVFDGSGAEGLHLSYIHREKYGFHPVLLVAVTNDDEQYVALGLNKPLLQGLGLSLGVGFHAGFTDYSKLGYKAEFYSNLHLDYRHSPTLAFRAEFGHISNGGLGDTNPGSEAIVVSVICPL